MIAGEELDTMHAFEGVPFEPEEEDEEEEAKNFKSGLNKEIGLLWEEFENTPEIAKKVMFLAFLVWGVVVLLFVLMGGASTTTATTITSVPHRASARIVTEPRAVYVLNQLDVPVPSSNLVVREMQDITPEANERPKDVIMFPDGITFSQVLSENKYVFVNYYVHWCEWSQKFRHTWSSLLENEFLLVQNEVAFVEVNCEVYKELCHEESVYAYPTLRLYGVGGKAQDYTGERTLRSLEDFLELSIHRDRRVQETTSTVTAAATPLVGANDEHDSFVPSPPQTLPPPAHIEQGEGSFAPSLQDALSRGDKYILVDFMAPWCVWCQKLNPIWDHLVKEGFRSVTILRVDCVKDANVCRKHTIQAFPTIRLFVDGEPIEPDHHGDRTLVSIRQHVVKHVEQDYGLPFDGEGSNMKRAPLTGAARAKIGDATRQKLSTLRSSNSASGSYGTLEEEEDAVSRDEVTERSPPGRSAGGQLYSPSGANVRTESFGFRLEREEWMGNNNFDVGFGEDEGVGVPPPQRDDPEGVPPPQRDDLEGVPSPQRDDPEGVPSPQRDDHEGVPSPRRDGPEYAAYDDDELDRKPNRLGVTSTHLAEMVEDDNQVGSTWDLEVEYAVRAKNIEKLWDAAENVLVSFTSSRLSNGASFRPTWHEFAHRAHHQSDLNNMVVGEIDCAVNQCPQQDALELPYYAWYHRGQQVGPNMKGGPQTTVDSLLATSRMMIDMEKKHTEE